MGGQVLQRQISKNIFKILFKNNKVRNEASSCSVIQICSNHVPTLGRGHSGGVEL